jgi:hypothetical protein
MMPDDEARGGGQLRPTEERQGDAVEGETALLETLTRSRSLEKEMCNAFSK